MPTGYTDAVQDGTITRTADERLVRAAVAWRDDQSANTYLALIAAVDARAAKLAPPDPVAELIAAGNAFAVASRYCTDDAKLAAAKARWVVAQEAARGKAP